MNNYKLPSNTKIGHVHLKVSDLNESLDFYHKLLGFEITTRIGDQAVFISAGGYHHHIGLNTWHSKNGSKPLQNSTGLYHTAILYPTRKDLAKILQRLIDKGQTLTGAADHGVSEALYLNDPDENGVELYWDKPKELWPKNDDGTLKMYTKHLNLQDLLKELN